MDQLNMDMERNPQRYRMALDPYEEHMSHEAMHVYDATRAATLQPTRSTYYDDYRLRMMKREVESTAAMEKRAQLKKEEDRKAMVETPFKFFSPIHIVSGIDQVFKNILKKSDK